MKLYFCLVGLREKAEVQLVSPDSKEKIRPGQEVILKCHAEGFPEVKVEWYRYAIHTYDSCRYNFLEKQKNFYE